MFIWHIAKLAYYLVIAYHSLGFASYSRSKRHYKTFKYWIGAYVMACLSRGLNPRSNNEVEDSENIFTLVSDAFAL